MTGEELDRLRAAKPFRAFALHLADGRELPVRSSEYLIHELGKRTFHVEFDDGSYETIDLLLVISATVAPLA